MRKGRGTSTGTLRAKDPRVVIDRAADDPIAAADGALTGDMHGVDSYELRRGARADDGAGEIRRTRLTGKR